MLISDYQNFTKENLISEFTCKAEIGVHWSLIIENLLRKPRPGTVDMHGNFQQIVL